MRVSPGAPKDSQCSLPRDQRRWLMSSFLCRCTKRVCASAATTKAGCSRQSWLFAREIAARWQLPARDDLLLRVVNTRHQVGLSKAERVQNVSGAFAVPERALAELRGKRVLLVDDVMTTGSTLLSCARTLHKAGVREVQSLTIASAIR